MGQIAKINNIEIWWEDFGNKKDPTVFLIMGANANCMLWPDNLISSLVEKGFHVVKFDNRDVGKSTWIGKKPFYVDLLPKFLLKRFISFIFKLAFDKEGRFKALNSPGLYSLSDMAQDAVCLMDHIKTDKAHVVGLSMGGMIAQVMALEHPERMLTMTPIMSTPGISNPNLPGPTKDFKEAIEKSFDYTLEGQEEESLTTVYKGLAGSRFPFNKTKFREELRGVIDHGYNPYTKHGESVSGSYDRLNKLSKINIPTLVIHGDEDPILPLEHGLALADNIPDSKKVILKGVGHEIPEELLTETINHLVNHFNSIK